MVALGLELGRRGTVCNYVDLSQANAVVARSRSEREDRSAGVGPAFGACNAVPSGNTRRLRAYGHNVPRIENDGGAKSVLSIYERQPVGMANVRCDLDVVARSIPTECCVLVDGVPC